MLKKEGQKERRKEEKRRKKKEKGKRKLELLKNYILISYFPINH